MFRKPKSRNIRQRARNDVDEDRRSSPSPNLANIKDETAEDDEINEVNSEGIQESVPKPKSILSFEEDEGDDIVDFKLKRSSRHDEKSSKRKTKRAENLEFSTKNAIKIEEEEQIIVVKQLKTISPVEVKQSSSAKPKFRIPEKVDNDEEEDVKVLNDSDVSERFASAFVSIPDARAVYEARKKREQMRQGGGADIPMVDDTVRLKNANSKHSGERSRLVREDDDNDMSDEDNLDGKFYSSKSLLITEEEQRRDQQAQFLRMEQGTSDAEEDQNSDEDELARWEREQIRKGVSVQKVNQLQSEMNATSLFYRGLNADGSIPVEQGDADMDVEILETTITRQNIVLPDGSLPGSSNTITLDDILSKIQLQIERRQEHFNVTENSLNRVETNLSENQITISQLECNNPNLQQRFRMFQEMRLFTRDLLECLNEKVEEIGALEEQIMAMWKKRSEKLIRRSRQDVQDQYDRCAALALGRQWMNPTPEYSMREAEREGRRNRRRREREKNGVISHNEGLSSDDEETTSQKVVYADTTASVLEKARGVFIDASDEFCSIKMIVNRFIDWYAVDEDSYGQAYVSLCLPKLVSPFIRLELLDWNALQNGGKLLHVHNWYKQLLSVGLENMGMDADNTELVNIIPTVVEKVILPKIARIIEEQWNPMSLSESRNLATLLKSIIDDYPTANVSSKRTNEILQAVYKKMKASIDEDTFVPLYSKEAIETLETGCGAFLDRQFWRSVKLIRSLCAFRHILSDVCLEELVIEGIMNRSSIVALQFSALSDASAMVKCQALVGEIPSHWLPSARPMSYRPLINVLSMVVDQHKSRDREFCKQMQKFINLARKGIDELL